MSVHSISWLYLLPSDLTESNSKQALSCLQVACLFIYLFLNLRLPDRDLLFSCMSGFWNHLFGQFSSSSMRQSWTWDSALPLILVAFSLHSSHFHEICIFRCVFPLYDRCYLISWTGFVLSIFFCLFWKEQGWMNLNQFGGDLKNNSI